MDLFAIAKSQVKFQGLRGGLSLAARRPGRRAAAGSTPASLAFSVLMRVTIDVAVRPELRL